jgi:hypothetical protein
MSVISSVETRNATPLTRCDAQKSAVTIRAVCLPSEGVALFESEET